MTTPDGPGIWHFSGIRWTPSRMWMTTVNDLVDVRYVLIGASTRLAVARFGTGKMHDVGDYDGTWERLLIEFNGERSS